MERNIYKIGKELFITSDEEIKNGDWALVHGIIYLTKNKTEVELKAINQNNNGILKIILTTDQDLIKDGVQKIDNDFLEWLVKNPNCEEVEVREIEVEDYVGFAGHTSYPTFHKEYKIILPKEEFKQEKPKKIFDLPIATNLGSALTETMKSISQHEGGIKQGEINLPNFKEEVIKTEEDAKIFVETMENIPEPNDKLKKAFRDFNKQEIVGYRLKPHINRYMVDGILKNAMPIWSDKDKSVYFIKGHVAGSLVAKMKELQVLDLWFTPIYENEEIKSDWVKQQHLDSYYKEGVMSDVSKQETLEKYSERFNNKENEVVDGIFNPENWGRRVVKQETLEEALERLESEYGVLGDDFSNGFYEGIVLQKEQNKNLYSEEEVQNLIKIIEWYDDNSDVRPNYDKVINGLTMFEWFNQFKKK